MTTSEDIRAAVLAERERIARWHERQAIELELAMEAILAQGGAVEVTQHSLVHLHRRSAEAIRAGAE